MSKVNFFGKAIVALSLALGLGSAAYVLQPSNVITGNVQASETAFTASVTASPKALPVTLAPVTIKAEKSAKRAAKTPRKVCTVKAYTVKHEHSKEQAYIRPSEGKITICEYK